MKVQTAIRVAVGSDGSVSLSSDVLRRVGWEAGDLLRVEVLEGGALMLSRRRQNAAQEFAGAFTDLYPDPEETRRFLDEGRGYVEEDQTARTRSA